MIIYKDAVTGDELFTDTYPMKLVDDMMYEVSGKTVTEKAGVEVDTGANPSEEGGDGDEAVDDGSVTGCNIVLANRLVEYGYSKKDWLKLLKDYCKKIKSHLEENNPERVEKFVEGAKVKVKELLANYDRYRFYLGESMNPDGMIILMDYREDNVTPFMIFFKDGLVEEKL